VDVVPLLAEVADLYDAVAEERGITLMVSTPPQVPAYGDRALIQQAIANLVDNAVKFSPSGGAVGLEASIDHAVAITVTDQGAGIPPNDRAKATDRFYRGVASHPDAAAAGRRAVRCLHGSVTNQNLKTLSRMKQGNESQAVALTLSCPGPCACWPVLAWW
jgi:K+-sensing histidine kinase KdpD